MADLVADESTKTGGERRPLTVREARRRLRCAADEADQELSPLKRVSPLVLIGAGVGAGLIFFKLPKVARTAAATGAGMLLKSKTH